MTVLCRWRIYILKDATKIDAINECFDVISCDNLATQEFTWSTQRLRDVYKASSSPVCDEHLKDFQRSDAISRYCSSQGFDQE